MRQKLSLLGLGVLMIAIATTMPADAANKEHQQLMADLRMLQEQSQVLQNLLGQLNEALKGVNTRLDQQTEANRKSMADQKLVLDNLTNDVRVIREKLDDNNVRLGSLSQEVDALRQAVQQCIARPTGPIAEPDAGAAGATTPTGGGAPAAGAVVASPTQMWDAAFADYTSGQYDLAVLGFEAYLKTFPKSDMADDAQVYICNAYLNDGKNDKAVEACDVAIRTYPKGNAIPEAYLRKGQAQANLRDVAGARATWDALIKNYPDSAMVTMAKQRLDQLPRRD